jgi:hypothetical protein
MVNCYSEMLEFALRENLPFPPFGVAPKIPPSSPITNEDGMKKIGGRQMATAAKR